VANGREEGVSLYVSIRRRSRGALARKKLARWRLRRILLRLAERAIAIREKPNDAAQQFQHETPKAEHPSCTDSGVLGSLANCRRRMLGTRPNRMELALYTAASANTFVGRVTRGVQPICYFTSSCEGIPLPLQSGYYAL
jgi:hypothetical protein